MYLTFISHRSSCVFDKSNFFNGKFTINVRGDSALMLLFSYYCIKLFLLHPATIKNIKYHKTGIVTV